MPIPKNITYTGLEEKISGALAVITEYRGIPAKTMELKLNPETWSCTEVCQHLVRFNRLYLREMNRAIKKTEPKPGSDGEFKLGWLTRKLGGIVEPPYKIGIKTITPMKPDNPDLSTADTLDKLEETNREVLHILEQAKEENWNLDKIKGRNPVFKIKMSLTEFIIYLDAHQRRHFWQIEQILMRLPEN